MNDNASVSVESLKEALEKTLSKTDMGLLLIHLQENKAIHKGQINMEQFRFALKELFGEGAYIFFELADTYNVSRREEAARKDILALFRK